MHRSVLLAALLLTVAIAGAQAPKIAGCKWTDATHGWECKAPLAAPSLIVTDGDKRTPLAPVFDSATVGSCTGRKEVVGSLAYCDGGSTIVELRPGNSYCGNGLVQEGEQCDPPGADVGCASGTCSSTCQCAALPTCGNSVIETGEECEVTGDCSGGKTCTACKCEEIVARQECTNGTIEAGEVCDPGGKTCATAADCGWSGTCTSLLCVAANGACTTGCLGDCSGCAASADPCSGANYYVRTDGSDGNAGTADTSGGAWRTIGKALGTSGADRSGGSKVVCVRDGTYNERVTFAVTASGTNTVTLRGTQSAILDPSTLHSSGWTLAADPKWSGESVYFKSIAGLDVNDSVASLDGKYIQQAASSPAYGTTVDWIHDGPWVSALGSGTNPGAGNWDVSDVQWGMSDGLVYVHLQDDSSPNGRALRFDGKSFALSTGGLDYLVLDGLTIKGAWHGLRITNGSDHVTARRTRFEVFHDAVAVYSGATVTDLLLEQNTFDQNVRLDSGVTMAASDPQHWAVWQWFKRSGQSQDWNAVTVDGTLTTATIRDNLVRQTFQGMRVGDYGSISTLAMYRNVLDGITDEGIDFQKAGATLTGVDVYGNTILNSNTGIRFGAAVSGTPLAFHENAVWGSTASAKQDGTLVYISGATVGPHLIYANSMSGRHCVGISGGATAGASFTEVLFVNNLCNTEYRSQRFASSTTPQIPTANVLNNWFATSADHNTTFWSGTLGASNLNSATGFLWAPTSTAAPTFEIPSSHATRNAGENLGAAPPSGQPWSIADLLGRGYDSSPDIGARQYIAQSATTTTTVVTTSTTTTTGTLPDWASYLDASLKFDTASPGADGGTCADWTTEVDFTQTTSKVKVGGSAAADATAADEMRTTCATIKYGGAFACGGWLNPTAATGTQIVQTQGGTSTTGWQALWYPASDNIVFMVGDGTGKCNITTDGAIAPEGEWRHLAFVATATTAAVYVGGSATQVDCTDRSPAPATSCAATNQQSCAIPISASSNDTRLGGDGTNGIVATFDDWFCDSWSATSTSDGVLDPKSLCRIISCGVSGADCSCGGDGTAWVSTGRWGTADAPSCTLPTACNQAQP